VINLTNFEELVYLYKSVISSWEFKRLPKEEREIFINGYRKFLTNGGYNDYSGIREFNKDAYCCKSGA